MPVNTDNVKQAFDDFMNDKYSVAKDSIRKEIKAAKNDFIKNKLNVTNDVEDGIVKEEKKNEKYLGKISGKRWKSKLNEDETEEIKGSEGTMLVDEMDENSFECSYSSDEEVLDVDWISQWAIRLEFKSQPGTDVWKNDMTEMSIQILPTDYEPIVMDTGGSSKLEKVLPNKKFEGQFNEKLLKEIAQWVENDVKKWLVSFIGDDDQEEFIEKLEEWGTNLYR